MFNFHSSTMGKPRLVHIYHQRIFENQIVRSIVFDRNYFFHIRADNVLSLLMQKGKVTDKEEMFN